MRQHTHASRSAAVPAAPVLQAKPGARALSAPARHDDVAPAGPAAQGGGTSLIDVPIHSKPVEPALGSGLPAGLKAGVESLSGLAMDDVRVHRDSPEPARLGALAYARGSDIHLGPGQEQHLPHEAWHVVQQKQGRVPATAQMKGIGLNDDAALEAEADRIESRVEGAVEPDRSAAGVPLQGGIAGTSIVQLQPGNGDPEKSFTKQPFTPKDNTDLRGLREGVATKKEAAEWKQNQFIKKMSDVPKFSQATPQTADQKRFSELMDIEYKYRDKYFTKFMQNYYEVTGEIANPYVIEQLYLLKNKNKATRMLDPTSPISIWRWIAMLGMAAGGRDATTFEAPVRLPNVYPTSNQK